MEVPTPIAVFAIAVGVLVAGMWTVSLATGNVPELATKPWEIRHHIAAEGLLALTMVGGGLMVVVGIAEGPIVLALGLGMTLYSIVSSSGYYVQRRAVPLIAMFAVLLLLTWAAALALVGSVA